MASNNFSYAPLTNFDGRKSATKLTGLCHSGLVAIDLNR